MIENNLLTKEELNDNLNLWIDIQRLNELSDNTLEQYRNAINKFINYLSINNINYISKNNMIDYKKYLNQISESYNSKNLWIVVINKYLKYLHYDNLCLKQIKVQQKYYNYDNMSYADYKRLLRISKKNNFIKDYYIMKTLAMTGIRVSELRFFTVENLKRQNDNVLHIYNKKKERDIPLRDDLARDLRKYCRENKIKSGPIFYSLKMENKMIHPSTIWRHMKKIAGMAKVKLKVVHPHSFRHLFADIFLETYPDNIVMLADLLGHSSLETTRLYTRKTLKQKQKMLSKMDFKEK